eukprot:scaffold88147_cov48-Phaeocystis_antarctica.AAC.3
MCRGAASCLVRVRVRARARARLRVRVRRSRQLPLSMVASARGASPSMSRTSEAMRARSALVHRCPRSVAAQSRSSASGPCASSSSMESCMAGRVEEDDASAAQVPSHGAAVHAAAVPSHAASRMRMLRDLDD